MATTLHKCFDDVVNSILFDEDDPSQIPRVNGMALSAAIEHAVALQWKVFKAPAHGLTMGLSSKLGLTKLARDYNRFQQDVLTALEAFIRKRQQSGRRSRSNLIDMMLDWNKKCDQEGKHKEKYSTHSMVGLINFFFAAGTDTSRSTLTSLLYYLGEESEARAAVEKDLLDNILDHDWKNINAASKLDIDWDKCPVLDQFVKEGQRMRGISTTLFYRMCIKDHKLGKITIKKGTFVNYPPMYFHHNEKYFSDPERFDITRFERDKTKLINRRAFAPFG